ncbi:radical SAM protein [Geoglobus acetivorans]|uniref:Radical SAM protein n=1 Tax=Geoglobus acetivorans TaxID=565033 RepID=A0ABZ3H5J1_GEOAI|nr:radical SAM protein [Geoglobus acetivorans]
MVKGLERYAEINAGNLPAKFQIAKRIPADKTDSLYDAHRDLKKEFLKCWKKVDASILEEKPADYSFLHLKVDLLNEMLKECVFCQRKCRVNRYERRGYCKTGAESYYSSEFLHFGEEPELVPSHTIFFNRCTFSCVFCQNWDIVCRDDTPVNPKELAYLIDIRRRQGSRNVNFVGGNPDQHAHTILEVLIHVNSSLPVVWNSNMYHSVELAGVIEDVIDLWLGDFKYGNDDCAAKYSNAGNYFETVTGNFLRAKKHGELLIRHLVMPGHVECCTERIVKWVSKNLGRDTRFNLMFQYWPAYRANEFPEISRRLNRGEIKQAIKVTSVHLDNLV